MRRGYLLEDYFYTDEGVYQDEIRKIFLKGSFVSLNNVSLKQKKFQSFDHLNIPMILANDGASGSVFLNMCPHKRMRLIGSEGSDAEILRCPYHGWQFNSSGQCLRAGFEALDKGGDVKVSDIQLERVDAKLFGKWGFVSQTGGFDKQFARDVKRALTSISTAIDAVYEYYSEVREFNWKLYFDNLHDDSHVPFLHSTSLAKSLDISLKERMNSRGLAEKFSDATRMSYMAVDGQVAEQQDYHNHIDPLFPRPGYYNIVAWPNLHIASSDGGRTFMCEIHEPLSSSKTRVHVFLFLRKNGWSTHKKKAFLNKFKENTKIILDEDFEACERVHEAKRLRLMPDILSEIDNRNLSRNEFYLELMSNPNGH